MLCKVWMVRSGRSSAFADEFLTRNIAAIGWGELGDLSGIHTRPEIKQQVTKRFPGYTMRQVASSTGQVYRFLEEMQVGDMVVTYEAGTRTYHLGVVESDYKYTPELGLELTHSRNVKWKVAVQRDALSAATKNSLGSISTIFCVSPSAAEELTRPPGDQNAVAGPAAVESGNVRGAEVLDEDAESVREDTEQRAIEFTQDRIDQLGWEQMQELVAGLLRAMGYRTRVVAAGPDGGRDIVASPDGLGFQQPRIVVEVKHRNKAMGSQDMRRFTGGLRAHDSGLYVSTGGFTKEARYEADRSNIRLELMDLERLSLAIWEHYEKMDAVAQALLPMKKIYWPL